MKKVIKIRWDFVWGNSFFFDMYREWIMVITKEYNHSILINKKQLAETRGIRSLGL